MFAPEEGSVTMNIMFFLTTKRNVTYLYNDEGLMNGLRKLRSSGYHAIPMISRDGTYMRTITEGDFLWLMVGLNEVIGGEKTSAMTVGEIPRLSENPAVSCDCPLSEVVEHAAQHNFVPVIDGRGAFIGIVTRKSIIQHISDIHK